MSYETQKTGGEESIKRSAEEATQEEEARLGPFKPPFSLKHLTLLPSLPDNSYYHTHDTFGDGLELGFGTDEIPPIVA